MTERKRGPHGWAKGMGPREGERSSDHYLVRSGPAKVWPAKSEAEGLERTTAAEALVSEELGRTALIPQDPNPGQRIYAPGDGTSGSW